MSDDVASRTATRYEPAATDFTRLPAAVFMAIVRPDERSYASGVTNLARTLGWAAGPMLAVFVMQHVTLAGPLLIGGTLKIVYDVLLYRSFRALKPDA